MHGIYRSRENQGARILGGDVALCLRVSSSAYQILGPDPILQINPLLALIDDALRIACASTI